MRCISHFLVKVLSILYLRIIPVIILSLNQQINVPVVGEDYALPDPLQVTFIAGGPNTPLCVTFDILDDSVLEGDHDFTVTITDVGSFAMIGTPFISTVTIDDDESEERFLFV